jgi:hypothetical protein
MPNKYFKFFRGDEFKIFQNQMDEVCEISGVDGYYLPRTFGKLDQIFGEDILSKFSKRWQVTLRVVDAGGWQGEGDLFSKFGIHVTDEITYEIEQNSFTIYTTLEKPIEGDLIYIPDFKTAFEITFVETDDPFFHLGGRGLWQIKTKVFEYSYEEMDTKIEEVDELNDLKDDPDIGDNDALDEENEEGDLIDFSEDSPFGQ